MPIHKEKITVQHNSKEYSGYYQVEGGVITVSANWRTNSTQLGSTPAPTLARMLLREMIDGGAFEEP